MGRLDQSLHETGHKPVHYELTALAPKTDILITADDRETALLQRLTGTAVVSSSIKEEGFQILRLRCNNRPMLCIIARDEKGAMYGTLDLAEQIRIKGSVGSVPDKLSNPRFGFRAIKFNLPWSSYRTSEALQMHSQTCRDLKFWQQFLDMMAENRFNVLSLWNEHPFTYMIRPSNFPEACPFSDEELAQWQRFWRQLFRMARQRGIETYIVNWNIVVSPEFATAYGVKQKNDTSAIVRRYTRQCVTQVINEYENLTGLGVTLADWMKDMTPEQREDWIAETFVAGIKQAKRPVKFIHRSVLAGSPEQMRRLIDQAELPDPVWVEIKFNWSHGHSTAKLAITHDYTSGKIDERFWKPKPVNYRIVWMIRNEDFFILRWGQPDFIKQHISNNGADYVGGYFVGSETYIPAKDYFHKSSAHVNWNYAFERQWLFYMLWGRLLYEPGTDDSIFETAFDTRYGAGVGSKLLKAYSLASKMPLKLASFYAATWDFTLYSEGFLACAESRGLFDGVSPFISINELIEHKTLDPTYLSVTDYVKCVLNKDVIKDGLVTPLELADELQTDGGNAIVLIESVAGKCQRNRESFECEAADVKAWAYLGLYFADKLRAATALESFRHTGQPNQKQKAVSLLQNAAEHWETVISVTQGHYQQVPLVQLGAEKFSWERFRGDVARDIQIAEQE